MQSWRHIQNKVSEALDQLESEVLYGVLPIASHPQFLSVIRQSSAWLSHQTQHIEHVQTTLIHSCHLAHQSDVTRTQVLMDEIKQMLRETAVISLDENKHHDTIS